ncbi:MAG: hypothetical protein ACE14P_07445 [Methanotrichaceae archaeon]
MRHNNIILLAVAVLATCLAATVYAAPVIVQQPTEYPLDLSADSMQIVSTEHTADYLARTSGAASSLGSYRNVAGNWTFELRDQRSRPIGDLILHLYQAGGVVFGKGVLKNGLREQPATADGSLLEGITMVLNAVTLEDTNLYVLSINIGSGNATSGSFKLYTPAGGDPLMGTIYGGSNEPRGFSD